MLIDEAIKQAARRRRWEPGTAECYARVLRRLSQDLAPRGQTIAAFDHSALAAHAMQTAPEFEKIKLGPALMALREYRQPLEDLSSKSPPSFAAAKRSNAADHLAPLPGASWNTANVCRGVPSAHSRADSANQPSSFGVGEFEASSSNPPNYPAYDPSPLLSPSSHVSPHLQHSNQQPQSEQRQTAYVVGAISATRVRRTLPQAAPEDQKLIQAAVQAAVARLKIGRNTARDCTRVLLRLADHFRGRGQTLVALDHDALVAHADQVLKMSPRIRRALTMLRNYREPGASADRVPRRHPFSQDDQLVIERAAHAAVVEGRSLTAVDRYSRSLRRFSAVLNRNGEGISTVDHGSLMRVPKNYSQLTQPSSPG